MQSRHGKCAPIFRGGWCVVVFFVGVLLAGGVKSVDAADKWWPLQVKSFYGVYDAQKKTAGQPSESLKGPKLEDWTPPEKAGKPYVLGVSFPHLKDSYWLAVNYGIVAEAKRMGVGIKLVEAGGYGEMETQVEQLKGLAAEKVDGVILGAISYKDMDAVVADIVKQGTPVVEIINDIRAQDITAKALVSFFDMGYYAGEYVAEHAEGAELETANVVFLPGPQNSGWAPDTLGGFKEATEAFPGEMKILEVKWGDTGAEAQGALIKEALAAYPKIDYIVGNAVAADTAVGILEESGRSEEVTVVSTYIIPHLYEKIKAGKVAAAPSDLTVFQGRMAVNMMVKILSGEKPGTDFPFRSGPFIPVISSGNIDRFSYEMLFGPKDFKPVMKVDPR